MEGREIYKLQETEVLVSLAETLQGGRCFPSLPVGLCLSSRAPLLASLTLAEFLFIRL